MTFYEFMTVSEFCIYKRETFWKYTNPTSFFQENPGVFHFSRSFSRSQIVFQEFPGVVATLFWFVNYTFTCQDNTLKPVNIET